MAFSHTRTLDGYVAQYVYVRAIGASFSLVSIVAQSACIGARDSVSPLVGVFIQSIANVIGDYVMVGVLGWGVAGAAWATIAAQVFGSIYLCSKISILLANLQAQADATGPQVKACALPSSAPAGQHRSSLHHSIVLEQSLQPTCPVLSQGPTASLQRNASNLPRL
jgi:hypothetical protein